MSSDHPVAVLMETDSILPSERDIRLEDYLNDKFQTATDFAEIDELIANVDRSALQLNQQLQDARNEFAESKKAWHDHTASILVQTANFEAQQNSINERLSAIASSDSVDHAVKKLEGPMEKLRRLELAAAYVDLMLEVDQLAKEAQEHLPGDVNAALKPYLRLKGYADNLAKMQPAADDAAAHLTAHVQSTQERLYEKMKDILVRHFKELLGRQDWTASDYKYGTEFRDVFKKLLDLQAPELACQQVHILLPMKVLADEQMSRFRYHFMRPEAKTTIESKPKQFLEWVSNHFEEYQSPLTSKVGPILSNHFRECTLPLISIYIDPMAAWITAFLPVVKDKAESYLRNAKEDSSAIHEMITTLIAFDRGLRSRFRYDGGHRDVTRPWKGVAGLVLVDWFDIWLGKEKEFAVGRYRALMEERKNTSIDYESLGQGKAKPTIGAMLIVDLLSNVTTTYRKAPRTQYKYRFLIEIQIAILLEYDEVLRGSLEAYKTNTTTVGRTLNAVSKEQQLALEGLGGMESLCKVLGSAEYIIATLKDWMMEPFFIDLFSELRKRAYVKRGRPADNLAYAKNRTSSTWDDNKNDGTVFDQTIEAFKLQKDEAEALIKEAIKYAMPKVFKAYFTKPQWTTIDESNTGQVPLSSVPDVTAELVEPIRWLHSYTQFLHRALSTVVLRRTWNACLTHLQDLLWTEVLMRSNFTNLGAAQFTRDLTAIWDVTESYIPGASLTTLGMPRLREAVVVLNLPVKGSDGQGKGKLSLDDVNERLFVGNEEAKDVVRELGLQQLDHWDTRNVVQRRVECVA